MQADRDIFSPCSLPLVIFANVVGKSFWIQLAAEQGYA